VVYAAFLYLFVSFRNHLDEELGARLMAVASAASAAVNDEVWTGLLAGDPAVRARVEQEFLEIQTANDLSDLFLFDPAETTVFDLRGQYPAGEKNPALLFDVVAVTTALAGLPAYTALYQSGDTYLKSGYAPVLDPEGNVIGGVGAEASAAFFAVLSQVRGTLLGAAGLVLVGMTILGVGFTRIQNVQQGLERRLRRTETLATMGQMTAMLAHEIRNPLGIIRGSAETLAERYGIGDDELYRFIPEEVDRLHRTLSSYLDFARTDRPAGHEDLADALERTLALTAGELERRGIVVERDLAEGPWPVRADAHRLQQAFLNLVLNAKDAMAAGGTLTVRLGRRGTRIRVEFADTGVGMDEATRARSLEPFYTSKEKGSGLGLAVVRRVAEDAGGRVEILSRPGEGTTVILTFPEGPREVKES